MPKVIGLVNKESRSLFYEAVMSIGENLLIADSIDELVDIYNRHQATVKVILIDRYFNKIDGYQVCSIVKQRLCDSSVQLMLIHETDTVLNRSLEDEATPFDDFVRCGCSVEELAYRIRKQFSIRDRLKSIKELIVEKEKKELSFKLELEEAATIQKSLLPKISSINNESISFYWKYLPSELCAGDILNASFHFNRYLCFYVVDVCGHGLASALLSSCIYTTLGNESVLISSVLNIKSNVVSVPREPDEILWYLNETFSQMNFGRYFSLLYGYIDVQTGSGKISSGGHPPMVIINPEVETRVIEQDGFLLGVNLPSSFSVSEFNLKKGDRLVLYTDGCYEFTSKEKEVFGQENFYKVLDENKLLPNDVYLDTVIQNLDSLKLDPRFSDDLTMMSIEFKG
jgi:phosphoserine phosphatase RsbU/P